MKHASAARLALALCIPLASLRAAAPTPADNSLRLNFAEVNRSIGVEPKGGLFHPMITADKSEETYTFAIDRRQPDADTIAVYSTDRNSLKTELPLARYRISGLRETAGSKIALTLRAADGRLEVSAQDPQHHGAPLTVTRLQKADFAQASLPPVKHAAKAPTAEAHGDKPPAIAQGPGEKPAAPAKSAGKTLAASVGLRSGEGTFAPFLRAGAVPGQTATVYLNRSLPGQTTADVTVYRGESPYLEGDRQVGRYLISGLSKSPKAMFALKFTVTPSGKVELTEASDSSSRQPLELHRYSGFEARHLQEASGAELPPPVAAAPFH